MINEADNGENKNIKSKTGSYSRGIPSYQQEFKVVQNHNQHFWHMGLLSPDNFPHNKRT